MPERMLFLVIYLFIISSAQWNERIVSLFDECDWFWLFPRLRRFWENVRPPLMVFVVAAVVVYLFCLFVLFCFVCFEVDISSRTLIPLFFMPGSVHSGSVNVARS